MNISSKEVKYSSVYSAVLELLNSRQGLASVNHSTLARMSRVSRPWIYKYVGKTKEDIIKRTTEHYIDELFRHRKLPVINELKELRKFIREDSLSFLQQAQNHPHLIPLIFIYFESTGPIGQIVRDSFRQYSKRLGKDIQRFLDISKNDADLISELISITRIGLAFFLVRGERPHSKGSFDLQDLKRTYSQLKQIL